MQLLVRMADRAAYIDELSQLLLYLLQQKLLPIFLVFFHFLWLQVGLNVDLFSESRATLETP